MARLSTVSAALAMLLVGVCCKAEGASARRLQQAIAAPGGACGAAINTRCSSGQCCSQYNFCGVTAAHCSSTCQPTWSGVGSTCGGAATAPAPAPPTAAPPTQPPPAPRPGCVDTFAACPSWGPASCGVPGVAAQCPCMCGGAAPAPPTAPPPTAPPPAAPTPAAPAGTWNTLYGVSYHLYDTATFPAIPGAPAYSLPGTNPGYASYAGLFCTDVMNANPGIPWRSLGWTATTLFPPLSCGDRVCIRNIRNGLQTAVYVVDKGGKGYDLDYQRVFKPLDPDTVNYARGSMDIQWAKC